MHTRVLSLSHAAHVPRVQIPSPGHVCAILMPKEEKIKVDNTGRDLMMFVQTYLENQLAQSISIIPGSIQDAQLYTSKIVTPTGRLSSIGQPGCLVPSNFRLPIVIVGL